MADQSSIFNENQDSGGTPPNTAPASNKGDATTETELTDLLNGIKNERGEPKYKTLKDAIIGLQNAQSYIPELKGNLSEKDKEIDRLKKEAERVEALEEAVRKLAERREEGNTGPKPLTEQDIAELVNKSLDTTLTQREIQVKQKENLKVVVSSLKSKFGDTAETKFNETAASLGMTIPEFNALAAKSPRLVLTALGITEVPNGTPAPTKGTVNSENFGTRPQSYIAKNEKSALTGASSKTVREESAAAAKMVEELHNAGKTVGDLTNPKVYREYFGL